MSLTLRGILLRTLLLDGGKTNIFVQLLERQISELSNFRFSKQIFITILSSIHLRDIMERRQVPVKYGTQETHPQFIVQIPRSFVRKRNVAWPYSRALCLGLGRWSLLISQRKEITERNLYMTIFSFLLHCCLVTKLCLAVWSPVDCSLPGSSVHGILQARILEWVAISFFRGSSKRRDQTHVSCVAGWFFATEPPGKW